MAKYKVLKSFMDIYTKRSYVPDQIIDLDDERYQEAAENLAKFGDGFLQSVEEAAENVADETKPITKAQLKKALDELAVEYEPTANKEALEKLLLEAKG